jgi:hemoglobin
MKHSSLYERLGGSAGIAKLVDATVAAHMENPVIKARFLPYRSQPHQHTVRFFAAGSGGPEPYDGRSMPEAHRGMNISEAEYMAATDDILAVLAHNGIDERTRNEVLAIAYSIKDQIMHR